MIQQLLPRYLKFSLRLFLTAAILMFVRLVGHAQTNEWAWMGGSNVGAMNGTWGTIGVAAVGNIPSSRSYAATWTDKQGNLWLFGGTGYDSQGHINVPMNDLWKLDPSSDEWTWMGGSDVGSGPGVYGTRGVASATNIPGGRDGASTWVDSSGNFWLFGGGGYDVNGNFGLLNDVWELNSSTLQWTWTGGANTVGILATQGGVYGTLGQPAPINIPAPRQQAAAWSDKTGHFWLFGGDGISPSTSGGAYNDLWEYDPASNEWTWMGGNSTACAYGVQSGVWGSMGTPAVTNIPSCRIGASSWVDTTGNLWVFGGTGRDIMGYWGDLNSLWEFNPTTKQWSWMGGGDLVGLPDGDLPGTYGTLGLPASGNIPSSRWAAATWTDAAGNFWLLGGLQTGFEGTTYIKLLNDLWEFNPAANEWAWMGGTQLDEVGAAAGIYGMLGTPSAGNMPGGREASASWRDQTGDFWLSSGSNDYAFGDLNDVWEYFPSAAAPVPGFALVDLNNQSFNNAQSFVVPAGTSGVTTINSVVSDGFNGTISLSASNLPDGVTATFSPALIQGFSSTSATYSVALNAVPGNYTTTVSGISGGVTETTTVSVTIASPPPPNFTLSAATSSLTLSPGGQGTVALTVTPLYGFNSTLTFTCSGLPAGVTCAFSPASVTPAGGPATTQMTLSASSQASIAKPTWTNLVPSVALCGVVCLIGWDQGRKWISSLVVALAFIVLGLSTACGGGGSGTGGGSRNRTPTTAAITVTASGAAMHSTTVTLTLN